MKDLSSSEVFPKTDKFSDVKVKVVFNEALEEIFFVGIVNVAGAHITISMLSSDVLQVYHWEFYS